VSQHSKNVQHYVHMIDRTLETTQSGRRMMTGGRGFYECCSRVYGGLRSTLFDQLSMSSSVEIARTLWRSRLSARVSECLKLKMAS